MPARIFGAAHNADNHQHADQDKDHHGDNLDQREPVFRFAKALHRDVINQEHQAQEQGAPDPAWRIREPVIHDQLGGHQIDSNRNRPVVPVVPAQRETEAFFDIFCTIGSKRARYRHKRRQFTQAGHQEVDHQAN